MVLLHCWCSNSFLKRKLKRLSFTSQIQNPESQYWRFLIMTRFTAMTQFRSTVILTFPMDGTSCGSKTVISLMKLQAITRSPLFGWKTRVHINAKFKEEAPWCSSQTAVHQPGSMFMVCVRTLVSILCLCKWKLCKTVIVVHLQSVTWLMSTCWPGGPRFFPRIVWYWGVRWKVPTSGITPGN